MQQNLYEHKALRDRGNTKYPSIVNPVACFLDLLKIGNYYLLVALCKFFAIINYQYRVEKVYGLLAPFKCSTFKAVKFPFILAYLLYQISFKIHSFASSVNGRMNFEG